MRVNVDTPPSSATRAVSASVGASDGGPAGKGEVDEVDADSHPMSSQPAQGPTPPIRSAVMWMTWPAGGLSKGGNFTPGPT